jgi:hypothetical protein
MGRRSLALLVILLAVGLALVPAAGALIVPKHSIAGASLLDTRAEIKAQLGQPLRIIHGTNEFGSFTRFHYHRLNVLFLSSSGAISIDTTRRRERTDRGIGVTSTIGELKDAYPSVDCQRVGFHSRLCVLGTQHVGRRVTVFRIHDGIITRIEVEFVVD